jgi:hypothetical protein
MEHHIYLSGPISNLTYAQCTGWRFDITEALDEFADIFDPMRDVDAPTPDTLVTEALDSIDPVMMTDRGIVVRDYTDTLNSTILIVNLLGATKVSIGTVAELAWAYHARIPTILLMEDSGNPHEHGFVREFASYRVTHIDRAIAVAKSLMGIPEGW